VAFASPSCSDPDGARSYAGLEQQSSEWGFNFKEVKISLRWLGWFVLFFTLGTLAFGILPMVWSGDNNAKLDWRVRKP